MAVAHRPMTLQSRSYASPQDAAIAFAALSTADHIRLGRIAQLRARGLPEVDWRDLLQEACARALDGTRRWPLDVPFLAFVSQSIRSVASEAWQRRRVLAASGGQDGSEATSHAVADDAPDPERQLVARDLLQRLQALFTDDPAALAILTGLAEGLSPAEIQLRAALTATAYDSARRRMRRTLARADLETL